MARETRRKESPARNRGKAKKTDVGKGGQPSGQRSGSDRLAALADLVQHMDRAAQVIAWRVDRLEQQMAHLHQILVSVHQLYENRRVDAWRQEDATKQLEHLRRSLEQSHHEAMAHLAREVATRR